MGLSKLLAVGRSVRSVTGQPARYEMKQQNLLPTFGGAKAGEPHSADAAPTVGEGVPKPAPVEPAMTATAEVVRSQSEPTGAKPDAFLEATKKLRPFGSWFKNPFARPEAHPQEKRPVQTELSLDAVKPLRNELNEPEIELGRLAPREVSEPAVPKASMETPAQPAVRATSLWQRLKARWFGGRDTN